MYFVKKAPCIRSGQSAERKARAYWREKMSKKLVNLAVVVIYAASLVLITGTGTSEARGKQGPEEQRAILMGNAKTALAKLGTVVVYTTAQYEGKKKKKTTEGTDVLTFTDRTVKSKNLAAMGYTTGGSNYSITAVGFDGSYTWETMQKHENREDVAYLRGDFRGGVMTGSMDVKSKKRGRTVYRFTTVAPTE